MTTLKQKYDVLGAWVQLELVEVLFEEGEVKNIQLKDLEVPELDGGSTKKPQKNFLFSAYSTLQSSPLSFSTYDGEDDGRHRGCPVELLKALKYVHNKVNIDRTKDVVFTGTTIGVLCDVIVKSYESVQRELQLIDPNMESISQALQQNLLDQISDLFKDQLYNARKRQGKEVSQTIKFRMKNGVKTTYMTDGFDDTLNSLYVNALVQDTVNRFLNRLVQQKGSESGIGYESKGKDAKQFDSMLLSRHLSRKELFRQEHSQSKHSLIECYPEGEDSWLWQRNKKFAQDRGLYEMSLLDSLSIINSLSQEEYAKDFALHTNVGLDSWYRHVAMTMKQGKNLDSFVNILLKKDGTVSPLDDSNMNCFNNTVHDIDTNLEQVLKKVEDVLGYYKGGAKKEAFLKHIKKTISSLKRDFVEDAWQCSYDMTTGKVVGMKPGFNFMYTVESRKGSFFQGVLEMCQSVLDQCWLLCVKDSTSVVEEGSPTPVQQCSEALLQFVQELRAQYLPAEPLYVDFRVEDVIAGLVDEKKHVSAIGNI